MTNQLLPSDHPRYLADVNKIHDLVWVGGDLATRDHAIGQALWLHDQGIRAVIDCRAEWDDAHVFRAAGLDDVTYHHIPTDDHGGALGVDWWLDVISAATPHINAGESIYVHCHMGVNRGPSAAFAILKTLLDYSCIGAYQAIKNGRPQAFVIYAPEYVHLTAEPNVAESFQAYFDSSHDFDELVKTIGRIRKAESGRYRLPKIPV